jgi:hypothetical protein
VGADLIVGSADPIVLIAPKIIATSLHIVVSAPVTMRSALVTLSTVPARDAIATCPVRLACYSHPMRTAFFLASSALAGLLLAAACGGSNPNTSCFGGTDGCGGNGGGASSGSGGASSGSGGASSGSGASSGGGTNLGGNVSEGGVTDDCSAAAKLVYVLSAENDLYSFDPPNKKFTKIGALGCKTSLTPNSMAVSRDAVAWVNYIDQTTGTTGSVFNVSTKDASCTTTNVNLQSGWTQVGMGFSTDSATSTSETLYVAATGNGGLFGGGGSEGLGSLSTTTDVLTPIGMFSGSLNGQNAELTGTGDGRLYGFFVTSPTTQIAQIDKTTGATSNVVPMTGVEVPNYWAFSFWGGDFYLYTCPADPSRTTNVTHYSPGTGTIDTSYMTNVGFRIVGAGVSTCAPTVQPPPQ